MSSGISATCAPWLAASRIRASGAATLASRSQLQAIWVAATVTSRIEAPFLPVSDHAEIFGGEIDGLAQAVDQLVDFLTADDQRRRHHHGVAHRSEERRVGKEGVSTCSTRGVPLP